MGVYVCVCVCVCCMYIYMHVKKKDMATHSNILAWRILWTEQPGWLQSIGLHSQILLKQLSMPACINTYITTNHLVQLAY